MNFDRLTTCRPSILERFSGHRSHSPHKPAIQFGARALTYSELGKSVDTWENAIAAKTQVGDIVLLFLPQTPESIACFFGMMQAACVPSFMPLPSSKQEPAVYWAGHKELLELIEPAVVVTSAQHAPAIRQILDGKDAEVLEIEEMLPCSLTRDTALGRARVDRTAEVAFLQHSSGTTGLKKGVALSHRAVLEQVDVYAEALGATSADVVVSWLPLYHDMGLIACTIMPLVLGQTLVLLDPFAWVAEPVSLFEAITMHGGTLVWLPNFSFEHLRRAVRSSSCAYDLSTVRAFINCSEPCKALTFDRFVTAFGRFGVQLSQLQVCYAMAETVFAASQTRLGQPVRRLRVRGEPLRRHEVVPDVDGDVELLSCGPLLFGCSVDIHAESCSEHTSGDRLLVGEIVVAAPFLFDGYYKRPERTNDVLTGNRYRTRDLGFMHDGELYVLGRKDDLLIANARNYYAHEIEKIANATDGIKPGRNVAVGIYNPEIGSEEVYLVQEITDLTKERMKVLRKVIREAVQDELGLLLRDVVLVSPGWLRKTTSGKISRNANKQKLSDWLAGCSVIQAPSQGLNI